MAAKPRKPRKKKGAQPYLEGMGPERNEKVHPLAEEYLRCMRNRVKWTNEETESRLALIEAMHEEGMTFYELADEKIFLSAGAEKVKVVEKEEADHETNGETGE